jgi:hypothetical protein
MLVLDIAVQGAQAAHSLLNISQLQVYRIRPSPPAVLAA